MDVSARDQQPCDINRVVPQDPSSGPEEYARVCALAELGALATECPGLARVGVQQQPREYTWARESVTGLRGTMRTYPLMAALAELAWASADEHGEERIAWLRKMTAALAESVLKAPRGRWKDAAGALYVAGLAIRKLLTVAGVRVETVQALTPLQPEPTPAEWQHHLHLWCETAGPGTFKDRVQGIERCLAFLCDVRDPRPRGAESKSGRGKSPAAPGSQSVPDRGKQAESSEGDGSGGGTPPLSVPGVHLLVPSEPDLRPPSRTGPRMASRQQAGALRAQRQGLPGIDRHPLQAVVTLEAIQAASGTVAAILLVALLSGEPKALRAIRVAGSIKEVPPGSQDFHLVMDVLVIAIPNRVQATLPKGDQDRPIAERLLLPIQHKEVPGLDHLYTVAAQRLADGGANALLFTTDDLANADAHLRSFAAPRRITCAWLAGLQRQFCDSLTGGTLDFDLAVGASADLAMRTRAHYRSVSATQAVGLRLRLIEHVLAWLHNREHVEEPIRLDEQQGYLGSRFLPYPDEVRKLITHLQAKVEKPPRGRPTLANVAPYHNALIVYTLLMLLWSTGARPTGAALEQFYRFNSTLILRDKGSQGGERVAVMPPMARAQRRAALDRMEQTCVQLKLQAPQAWFWVDQQGQPRKVTVGWLMREAQTGFAPNAGRHAWINAMRRAGLREDRVALHAGHRALGNEPGDPWSTANPAPTPRELELVDRYLRRMGWRVISSSPGGRRRG